MSLITCVQLIVSDCFVIDAALKLLGKGCGLLDDWSGPVLCPRMLVHNCSGCVLLHVASMYILACVYVTCAVVGVGVRVPGDRSVCCEGTW